MKASRSRRCSFSCELANFFRHSMSCQKWPVQACMFFRKPSCWSPILSVTAQISKTLFKVPTKLRGLYSAPNLGGIRVADSQKSLSERKRRTWSKSLSQLARSNVNSSLSCQMAMQSAHFSSMLLISVFKIIENQTQEATRASMTALNRAFWSSFRLAKSLVKGRATSSAPNYISACPMSKYFHPITSNLSSISHLGAFWLPTAILNAQMRFSWMMSSMSRTTSSLFSTISLGSLSILDIFLRQAWCLVAFSLRVTTTETESQSRLRRSSVMRWKLNMLMKPEKVLMMPSPEFSISLSSLRTIRNLALVTRSKTAFRKQETPRTPTQSRLSRYPAMSMISTLLCLLNSTTLGQRVTEVKVSPSSAASLSLLTTFSQCAVTQSPTPSNGLPRIQLKVVDLPARVRPTRRMAVGWDWSICRSPRYRTRQRLVLSSREDMYLQAIY